MRWLIGSQPWQSSVLTDSERVDADCSEGLSGTMDGLYPGGGLRFLIWSHKTYQTQLNESYWWESHVPTRLYLAPRDRAGASQGTSGRS